MKKIFALLFMMFLGSTALFAAIPDHDARQKAVDLALANAEAASSTDPAPVTQEQAPVVSPDNNDAALNSNQPAPIVTSPVSSRKPVRHQHLIELAFQIYSYDYKTGAKWPYYYAQNYSTSDKVTKSGGFYGLYIAKTWHNYAPIRTLNDLWQNYEIPNFMKVEAEINKGSFDYKSFLTGTRKGINALSIDARVLLGYDFSWNDVTTYSPYLGIGYQRFRDKSGGYVDYFIYNYASFTNLYNLLYLPIGMETNLPLNDQWDMDLKLEGDIVVWGQVDYDLNEIPGTFTLTDVDTGLPYNGVPKQAQANLRGGLGFRASCKLIKKFKYFDFYVEPFVRFLYLNQSEHTQAQSYGVNNGKNYVSVYPNDSPYKPLWDAKNTTVIVGGRTGIQF